MRLSQFLNWIFLEAIPTVDQIVLIRTIYENYSKVVSFEKLTALISLSDVSG